MLPASVSGKSIAGRAAMVAAHPNQAKAHTMTMLTSLPDRAQTIAGATATAHVLEGLRLFGHSPADGEPDHRPMPDEAQLDSAIEGMFSALTGPFADTALAADLQDLLWSLTDLLHRKVQRVQRVLDDNEQRQRAAHEYQDGSEVRSVELERLIEQGRSLLERRAAYEHMRDLAVEHFEAETGSAWRPRSGSLVNHKHLTASLIDSRDFIAAKRRAETEVLMPAGPKVAFSGGIECTDVNGVWAALDKVRAKYPDMVLLHGGSGRGADKIATLWADARGVTEIAFKPDFRRDRTAAPFKRNDRMLEQVPIGLIVFPGTGITDNLADKARVLGIPVADYRRTA